MRGWLKEGCLWVLRRVWGLEGELFLGEVEVMDANRRFGFVKCLFPKASCQSEILQ